ncbi:OmpP1/FadL family transporter [Abyssalbus ytuae]|uniref:Outer membrane protein transport protein n=1 Tax=Abyssalbus ytuae TaxID=2926907 RepID=A0A9E6ZJ67_9FLAO|nr:outer membrane protein transport protein [Abyssalbus ytuae]UOB16544.1 outer membrane protein transport protein [Abyssalbus ytuae]
MKNISILLATVFVAMTANAQNINDVVELGNENLIGTARFQAMSGAFGALGGDLSAININPASSAVFNNNFFTVSGSNYNVKNDASYGNGLTYSEKDNNFDLNQLGAVLVLKNSNDNEGWKKIALAFNYDMVNNYDNEFFAQGSSLQSINQYFLNYAQGQALGPILIQPGEFIEDAYLNIGADLGYGPQQAFLGYFGGVIDPVDENNDNNVDYEPTGDFSEFVNQEYYVNTTGYNSKLTVNFATQYGENLYMGLALNFNILDKEKLTAFYENGYDASSSLQFVSFDNLLRTYGNGFSFSLGGIAKLNDIVRLGASYQSPTWYNLTDELSQRINSTLAHDQIDYINFSLVNVFPDYKIQIPGKLTASAALVFGKEGLISFDYGYQDMSNAKLKPTSDPAFAFENDKIENELKAVSSIRVGGEYRFKQLSLRAGYRFEESPYENGTALGDLNGFSLGAGYDFGRSRIDLGFSQLQRDINYQLFETGLTNAASIDNKSTNVTLSVSFNL